MPLPFFQAVGTAAPAAGATVSPGWPTHVINDVALLFTETIDEAVTLSDAQGFVSVGSQGVSGTRLSLFWCLATSAAMSAPTIAAPSNHIQSRIFTFRGCRTDGNPWDALGGDTLGAGSTTVTIPAGATTVAQTLVVFAFSSGFDSASAQLVGGFTNASLADITTLGESYTALGNGGGFAVGAGSLSNRGGFTATTATIANSAVQGHMTIGLVPPNLQFRAQPAGRFVKREGFAIRGYP